MPAEMNAPFKTVIDGGGPPEGGDMSGDPFEEFRQAVEGMDVNAKREALKQFEDGMMEHVREQLSDIYEEVEGPAEEEAEPESEYPEEGEMHGEDPASGAPPMSGANPMPGAPPMPPKMMAGKTMMGARR